MNRVAVTLTSTFERFVRSEQSGGLLLIACTALAMTLTNLSSGAAYVSFWHAQLAGLSLGHWVNDGLMAIFFLLIGLELERELYVGELSEPRKALLPMVAALGGMLVPAAIHYLLNADAVTQPGFGIPMATDIAFALGVLALLGKTVPVSLKVFIVAFAVIDDLGAIVIIALFYTSGIATAYLVSAIAVWLALIALNRGLRVMALAPYLLGGVVMWFLMLKSGIHATIAGVLLAFAIPFRASAVDQDGESPSHRLEHALHRPVAFLILPIFALANAGIAIEQGWMEKLLSANSIGIASGLMLGKPVGVMMFCLLATSAGWCRLPPDLRWSHIAGAGMLGGIGFTMSIFITNLAFVADASLVNSSKMAILLASLMSGVLGYLWLNRFCKAGSSAAS